MSGELENSTDHFFLGLVLTHFFFLRLVSNLLAVICGDAHVTPTFSVSDNGESEDKEADEAFRKQMMSTLSQIALNTVPRK